MPKNWGGIILAHQPPILPNRDVAKRLLVLLDNMTADEFVNLIRWV